MSQSKNANRAIGIAVLAMMFGAGSVYAQSSSSTSGSSAPESGAPNTSNTPASGSSASGSAASSKVSHGDKSLMDDLAKANLSEIETAKMVQGKTQNDQVKQYAQKMIDDHTQAQQQLQQLAEQKGVKLPTDPDLKHKAEMKAMSALSGDKLDKTYMSQGGLSDHRNAHKLLAKIESKAKDPDLKALGAKLMPIIDQHLAMARDIAGSKSTANMSGSSQGTAGTSGTPSGSSGSSGPSSSTGASGTSGSSNSTSPSK
jgi:putative membrane protein